VSIFKRRPRGNLVPIHADNAGTRDWLVLLEAATIVGRPRNKLRVALTTQERKLVKKYSLFHKTKYFLVVDGFDPRIHALYFCPQLYTDDRVEVRLTDSTPKSGEPATWGSGQR
jgi:hypothetical protein